MTTFDCDGACDYALQRLTRDLLPSCIYHSVAHTRDEVVPAVERLASMSGIRGEELLLLRTAAWFHDVGFVECRRDHEQVSVQIMATTLPQFGYDATQLTCLAGMIMATRLPQTPRSLLEELLADADLDNLGTESFFQRNQDLRLELAANGEPTTSQQWYVHQLAFLQSHHYWSAAAISLRELAKQRHIALIHELLRTASGDDRAPS